MRYRGAKRKNRWLLEAVIVAHSHALREVKHAVLIVVMGIVCI